MEQFKSNWRKSWKAVWCLALTFFIVGPPALAQEDNTGTNPANFTYDMRMYTEMADLDGEGSLVTSTFELRWPLGRNLANVTGAETGSLLYNLGTKTVMRIRARFKNLSINTPGAEPFGTSEVSGIGDLDARVLYMAYASRKFLLVVGAEGTFDTATNSALGSGKTLFAPQAFALFPGVLGGRSIFAPGYQYVFDIAGDDDRSTVSRSQIDLYFVWLLAGGKNWLIVDPQIVIDHENGTEPALIEVEWGFLIAPAAGASGWIRPGVGIGKDKPYSWNFEAGLKFVWR